MSIAFQQPATESNGLGFPPATPVDEMTDAQQAAYWRHQSKKQQREFRAALGTIRRTIDDLSPH